MTRPVIGAVMATLLRVTAWLMVGHVVVAGLFWGLLNVPESNVAMLGLSAMLVVLLLVVEGLAGAGAVLIGASPGGWVPPLGPRAARRAHGRRRADRCTRSSATSSPDWACATTRSRARSMPGSSRVSTGHGPRGSIRSCSGASGEPAMSWPRRWHSRSSCEGRSAQAISAALRSLTAALTPVSTRAHRGHVAGLRVAALAARDVAARLPARLHRRTDRRGHQAPRHRGGHPRRARTARVARDPTSRRTERADARRRVRGERLLPHVRPRWPGRHGPRLTTRLKRWAGCGGRSPGPGGRRVTTRPGSRDAGAPRRWDTDRRADRDAAPECWSASPSRRQSGSPCSRSSMSTWTSSCRRVVSS